MPKSVYVPKVDKTVEEVEELDFEKVLAGVKQLTEGDEGINQKETKDDQHLIEILARIKNLADGNLGKKDIVNIFQYFGQNFKDKIKAILAKEQAKLIKAELEQLINNIAFEDKELEQQMNELYIFFCVIVDPEFGKQKKQAEKKEKKKIVNPSINQQSGKNVIKNIKEKEIYVSVKSEQKATNNQDKHESVKLVKSVKATEQQIDRKDTKQQEEKKEIKTVEAVKNQVKTKVIEQQIDKKGVEQQEVKVEIVPVDTVKNQVNTTVAEQQNNENFARQQEEKVEKEPVKLVSSQVKTSDAEIKTNENFVGSQIVNEADNGDKEAKVVIDSQSDTNKVREILSKTISCMDFSGKKFIQDIINEKDQNKKIENLKLLQLQLVPYYDGHIDGIINENTLTAVQKYIEKNLNTNGDNIIKSNNPHLLRCKVDGNPTDNAKELNTVIKKIGDNSLGHAYFLDYPDFEYTFESDNTITATIDKYNYFYDISTDSLQKQLWDDPLQDVIDDNVLKGHFMMIATNIAQ